MLPFDIANYNFAYPYFGGETQKQAQESGVTMTSEEIKKEDDEDLFAVLGNIAS